MSIPKLNTKQYLLLQQGLNALGAGNGAATATLSPNVSPTVLASPYQTYQKGNITINVFDSASALNEKVSQQLIREFIQAGTIILPADSTHGDEAGKAPGDIYRLVNEYFAQKNKPNSSLLLTHMDQLNFNDQIEGASPNPDDQFSTKIQTWLTNVANSNNFYPIDSNDLAAYKAFVEQDGGARVIVGGVGAEPPPHIAYIGEATDVDGKPFINDDPASIKLRPDEAERRGVNSAVTMGMSFFNSPKLEKVIISAKGEHKARSVVYALKDGLMDYAPKGKSAFGELIRRYAKDDTKTKLILNFDRDAFKLVANDAGLMEKLRNTGLSAL